MAVAGGAFYTTSLRVKDSSFRSERDDTYVEYQGMVGAGFFLSRNVSIGVEYRKFKLDADIEPTIPGKIDAGGDFLFTTARADFEAHAPGHNPAYPELQVQNLHFHV